MKKVFIVLVALLFAIPTPASQPSKRVYYEKDYQNAWCSSNKGTQEFILHDQARVDCVTATHAIEFDFADKWGESIGQALYYGVALNKQAGIVLIIEDEIKDQRYLNRVRAVAKGHNITVWTINPEYVFSYLGKTALTESNYQNYK